MGMLPPVVVELRALGGDLKSKIGDAKSELNDLDAAGNKNMKSLQIAGKAAALGVAAIAVVAIGAGAAAVHMASAFQESTTSLVTGAGESEANIDMVRKGILAMAGAVGTMPEELSKGLYLINSAGYKGAQGLSVLRAAAMGAKVGGADMAVVANGLTTALTDYNIPASRSNAVTSALVATVAAGKMKMQDLASSLGAVMPKAAALGVSFQDVTGAMATMTGAGMTARKASMNLANAVMAMGAPGAKATDALKSIGLTAQQVKDDLSKKGLAGTMAEIEDHVGNKFPKGSVAATTALKDILGGTTGYGVALALTGTHMSTFAANVKSIGGALKGQSSTVEGFSLVQKDLSFQVSAAKATMNAWGITIGTALLPIVTKVMVFINTVGIPALKNLAASFTANVLPTLKLVAGFISGTVLPALMSLGKFLVGTVIPGIVSFGKFLYNAREPLAVVAAVITALFIPALLRMGVQSVISGAETVALWVMINASAIAGTAVSVAQFIIQGAKWVWMGVVAMAGAIQIAAAWVISMGPIGIVIAAVIGLGILIATHMDQIKGWIGGAWNWIKATTSAVWGAISGFFSSFWASIVSGFSTAWSAVTGFFSSVGSAISGFVGKVVSIAATILYWWSYPYRIGIAIVIGLVELLAKGVMVVVNFLTGAVTAGFQALWGFIAPIFAGIRDFVVGVWNSIVGFVVPIVTFLVTATVASFQRIWTFAVSIFNAVWGFLVGVWNTIYATVSGAVSRIWAAVSGAFTAVWSTVSSIMGTVTGAISGAWNSIYATVSGIAGRIWSAVSGAFGRIASAISGAVGSAVSAAGSLVSRVVDAVKGGVGSLFSIGGDIVSGLINGITGAAGRLWSAITSFIAKNVPAPVRKLLGLASPSKLFAEFGHNTVEGFIVGVEGHKGALASTMASLVQVPGVGALGGFGGGAPASGSWAATGAGSPAGVRTASSSGAAATVHIENYHEAQRPPNLIAADLAFMLRTA
jgi:TP901 family phage tail tape measure protein